MRNVLLAGALCLSACGGSSTPSPGPADPERAIACARLLACAPDAIPNGRDLTMSRCVAGEPIPFVNVPTLRPAIATHFLGMRWSGLSCLIAANDCSEVKRCLWGTAPNRCALTPDASDALILSEQRSTWPRCGPPWVRRRRSRSRSSSTRAESGTPLEAFFHQRIMCPPRKRHSRPAYNKRVPVGRADEERRRSHRRGSAEGRWRTDSARACLRCGVGRESGVARRRGRIRGATARRRALARLQSPRPRFSHRGLLPPGGRSKARARGSSDPRAASPVRTSRR